jgi:hypothetical protein
MRLSAVLLLAVAVGLTACKKEHRTDTHAAVAARPARLGPAVSQSAPASLPPYAAVYPGSTVSSSVSGMGEPTAGMVTFSTPASAEDVMRFYKDRAAAQGLTETAQSAEHHTRSFNASKPGSTETVSVTTAPDPDGEGTVVQITYG